MVAEGLLRVSSINVNNLSAQRNQPKDEQFFGDMDTYNLGVTAVQELGVNWTMVDQDNRLQSRLNEWFEPGQTACYTSHNTRDKNRDLYQHGGTAVIARGKIKHYAMGAGSDAAKLGRWAWARYSGKGGMVWRMVSIYQPCENKTGEQSVWSQQKRHLQETNDDRDPRTAFKEDLKQELRSWIDMGDTIVIGGDVNESVHHHSIAEIFDEFNIRNLLFELHDPTNAPRTYFRSSEGRIVDGLWGTPGVEIVKGGYLEPNDFTGDHSLLWADLRLNSLLGHNPPKPQNPQARRLQTWNTPCAERYLTKYETLINAANLPNRAFSLEANSTYGQYPTPVECQEADAIDHIKTKAMIQAEQKCRKLRFGKVEFSETTDGPIKRIDFWETAIKRRRLLTVKPALWQRKKTAAKITENVRLLSIADMITRLKQAKQDYRKAKKTHEESRTKFLDTLPQRDRDRLKRKEEQRKLGRAAKRVTGKLASKSVTKIIVNGQECNSKADIEGALLPINHQKIQASNDTPCLQEPIRSDFGPRNNSPHTEQVLNGTYVPPPGVDECTRNMIAGMQRPAMIASDTSTFRPRTHISTDDHIQGWKKAPEKTSAGMSQIHFGMYKTHIRRRRLAALDAALRSYAYTTGFAFRRWKKGLDVQLLKRAQDFRAEKLRTILLLEADFNMNNKTLGRDAMRSGERCGALNRDNYGGRNKHRAAEVSLNSHLTHNSLWARRGRAILMSNDAKGCYDRIAHIVVDWALRRLGIPKPAMQSMLETIQEMEHHVRTAFGDSEESYGSNPDSNPNQGILQGNGAGPAGWSAISSVIIDAMKKAGFGYRQWSVIRKRAMTIVCFAFVDDTDLIHANNDPNVSTDELIDEAQSALSTWEGLIRSTGGALAPEKSYWYLVDIVRKKGKWRYRKASNQPGDLYLQQGQHLNTRLEVNEAREALGIMIRPDGSMKDEYELLQNKVIIWCDAVRTKRLKPSEAWYCLTATIMKTIEYPLIATTLSRKQVDDLMQPIWKTALNLCKIQKKMPRKLIYGTLKARGLGLKDPFLLQLIFHLQTLQRHAHRDTPTHDLLDENMELVQLHVGSKQPFWDLPFELYGPLAPTGWIKHTWKTLWETSLSIRGPSITVPPQRTRDKHLTDSFIEYGYEGKDLIDLQNCRLFLRATTLADITSACGNRIEQEAWQGKPSINISQTNWINTHRPGYRQWNKWRAALRKCFLLPTQTHTRLRQPLGQWTTRKSPNWTWWKHQTTHDLYEQMNDNSWIKWTRAPTRNFTNKYHNPSPVPDNEIPLNLQRASVAQPKRSHYTTVLNTSPIPPIANTDRPIVTLADRLQALPVDAHWAIRMIQQTDDGYHIAQCIQQGTAVAVGDGSLKLGFGTAGFTIRGPTDFNKIEGVNVVPGPIAEGDSHRCEVSGLYSIVILVNALCEHYNITTGSITLACDNTHALRLFDEEYAPDPQHKNFDLVSATWNLQHNSPISWKPQHVKGHQDDKQNYHTLPRISQINVQMDLLAKHYWQQLATNPNSPNVPIPEHIPIHGEEWQLWNGSTKINSPNTNTLYDILQTPITQQWWIRHNFATRETTNTTDWTATEQFMTSLPSSRRRYVTKCAATECGVGTTLVRWKFQNTATCPRCPYPQEDTTHTFLCVGCGAGEVWKQGIETFTAYLSKTDTRPDVQDALLHCLDKWHSSRSIRLFDFSQDIRLAIRQQHKIGWQAMLEGLVSKEWQKLQFSHYKENSIRKSSKRWIKGVLTSLHHLGWNLWNHRNNVKHRILKPHEAAQQKQLDSSLIRHLLKGSRGLPPGDQYHFRYNISTLLKKPLAFKKSWLLNVLAAKTRAHRLQTNDEEDDPTSAEDTVLLQWIQKFRPMDEE